jgi:Capsule assembly protein Wzi
LKSSLGKASMLYVFLSLWAPSPQIALGQQPPTAAQIVAAPLASAKARTDSTAGPSSSSLVLVTSEAIDRLRSNQLTAGVAPGQSLLLRSASALTPSITGSNGGWRAARISPQFLAVINTAIPFSQNYGSLWAGNGPSTRTLLGLKLESAHATLILAPEIILSANADWVLRQDFYAPPLPPDRSPYDLPYYVGNSTIDQPMRFGNKPIGRIDLGETTAMWSGDRVAFGLSNENEWWGPGIRNAIVLSNNAPGFPHLFVRSARPLQTRFGDVEMRWLVGGLTESAYFDTVSTNNTRSLASIAATLQTGWDPNLSFGFARSVYATATGWGQVPWRWFDVFAHTSKTKFASVRKDQLFSLFSRWVFPNDGVEVYGEWGRVELRPSLRDFLIAPNHTQGYTLGLQWRGASWRDGNFRLQGEITQLEQSATFRDTAVPSWYTSTRVIQGYTNRGEMLGASIGPGAQSQFAALDYLRNAWRFGTFGGRIRWNEDVHDNFGFPGYAAFCNQDVSLYGGLRGAKTGRLGSLTVDLTLQNRLNAFFQNAGGCPRDRRLDIHNNTLSINFVPGQ